MEQRLWYATWRGDPISSIFECESVLPHRFLTLGWRHTSSQQNLAHQEVLVLSVFSAAGSLLWYCYSKGK